MPRPKPEDIEKELQKQEDEVYGDETVSGTNPRPSADDDVEDYMEDVVGSDFDEGKELDIAEEVEEDEEDIQDKPIEDYVEEPEGEEELPESELEKIEKKEEDVIDDPYQNLTDDDLEEQDEDDEE